MVKLQKGVLVKLSAVGRGMVMHQHIRDDEVGIVIAVPKTDTQKCYRVKWTSGQLGFVYRNEVKFADIEQRRLNSLIIQNRILKEKYKIFE
tara:strand:+ start:2995 stop:3267 length:273 start_codon:yes stop_codon:yes gene_type:complete